MRKTILLGVSMALALVLACVAAALTAVPGVGQTGTVTLVGAGDIASCNYTEDSATAKLLGNIPGTVFTLGDNAYTYGTAADFKNCYDPTWGKYRKRTRPTAGNHEYYTAGAKSYFDYFGWRAGSPAGATTATIEVPGTSSPSTATATRWGAAAGVLTRDAG